VTRVLADHMQSRTEQRTAAVLYSGVLCGLTAVFNLLWRHAAADNLLIDKAIEPRLIERINRQYGFGPVFYAVSAALALVNPWASLAANFLIAIFFALPVWSLKSALTSATKGAGSTPPT
jgi:hypothetical protein